MRSKNQQLAREWSRMWPEDRALAKAIHQTKVLNHVDLLEAVRHGLVNAEVARDKRIARFAK